MPAMPPHAEAVRGIGAPWRNSAAAKGRSVTAPAAATAENSARLDSAASRGER